MHASELIIAQSMYCLNMAREEDQCKDVGLSERGSRWGSRVQHIGFKVQGIGPSISYERGGLGCNALYQSSSFLSNSITGAYPVKPGGYSATHVSLTLD